MKVKFFILEQVKIVSRRKLNKLFLLFLKKYQNIRKASKIIGTETGAATICAALPVTFVFYY